MRKIIFFLLAAQLSCIIALAQYWQQQVNYAIDVNLNDTEKTLDGFEKIEYINNSPDTLFFIWFHIWPNAYKNDKTAFTDQSITNGSTAFYFSDKEQRGYINRLDFKVDNITATIEDHPGHIDIIKVILPQPLSPNSKTTITTSFHVKIPYNFSRGGFDGQNFYIAHWYPKPAVYDKKGWHPMPMLQQGEFYSEFGNYDVSITLPDNYAVAATGELQSEQEKEWLLQRNNFNWQPVKEKMKTKGVIKTIIKDFPESSKKNKTLRYTEENIHDFAWFADKRYTVAHDTLQINNDKIIDCYAFYLPSKKKEWKNSIGFIKKAIVSKSKWLGQYPYSTVSVVQSISDNAGGTEYPTVTILDAPTENMLNYIIRHEVGHNWFYGILGSNEREYPWMDEGINSYYDNRYAEENNDAGVIEAGGLGNVKITDLEDIALKTRITTKQDQPIGLPAENYSSIDYNLSVYYKVSQWLYLLEKQNGRELFDSIMHTYYQQWKFKHPYPEDLKSVLENITGKNYDSAFSLLQKKGSLNNIKNKGTIVTSFVTPKKTISYIKDPSKNLISINPALGANSYDKLMIGALITNAKLPPSKFQFVLSPMYATGSKKLTGIGKLNYTHFTYGKIRRTDIFINAGTFSNGDFTDTKNNKTILSYTKLVPGIRLTFKEADAKSNIYKYIQFKNYFLKEDALRFSLDTTITGIDTVINTVASKQKINTSLGQLKFVIENNRALYPWSAQLNTEFHKDFIRLAFTGNYYFNYAKGGGMNVRLFAGKFMYLGDKTKTRQFATDRYHLNMTGANGYEDYTYSDYFIGRNRFEKLPSQQIMIRDGGFKVRTDLLAQKIGKTDDWLAALNFNTSIPNRFNPLSVLPVKIPLNLFFDLGTYAEAWEKNSELDRILYDAGIQVSVLKGMVNIYVPLLYSKPYKEYIQSVISTKTFIRKISFSIDISNFNLRKINNNFSL